MSSGTVSLRALAEQDLEWLYSWNADQDAEWRNWDGPYFEYQWPEREPWMERQRSRVPSVDRAVICVDDCPVGIVSRHEEAPAGGGWWELGIVIFDPQHWGGGIGTRALELWLADMWATTDAHVITMTTWSGNERMLRAAEKVGLVECARVPEARQWAGRRWDSVRAAVLRT